MVSEVGLVCLQGEKSWVDTEVFSDHVLDHLLLVTIHFQGVQRVRSNKRCFVLVRSVDIGEYQIVHKLQRSMVVVVMARIIPANRPHNAEFRIRIAFRNHISSQHQVFSPNKPLIGFV